MTTESTRHSIFDLSGHSGAEGRPGVLAAGMVHDLNNVLTVVLASLEQLRRQPLDSQGQRQLDRAQWGARQAARLARRVIALSRGEGGDGEAVDLNDVVGAFARTLGQAAGEGVGLVMEAAPGPLPARLDAGQLELALLNLVRNAADAMAGGWVVIRTAGHRVDGLGGQPTVEVAVSDTGTGMTPETARRARDAFFTTKGREQGTGLGLWMVHRFAAEAGGKVEIETAMGGGTTVRLVFPRAGAE